jgi:hypothetical protein
MGILYSISSRQNKCYELKVPALSNSCCMPGEAPVQVDIDRLHRSAVMRLAAFSGLVAMDHSDYMYCLALDTFPFLF